MKYICLGYLEPGKFEGDRGRAGLLAILFFSWLGLAAAGARTASRHQRRNVP